jgi:hypothetical protein
VKRNVKNDTEASWNGEIFTEQVRGQRYRIDSARGGAIGGSAPPVRMGYSVPFAPKMYRPSSSRHFLFDKRPIIPFIIVRQHLPFWA